MATVGKVLTIRFHYLISDRERRREELPISPLSATSARGKLVSWKSQLIALIYEGQDVVILNLHSGQEVGRIEGAGGAGCQEVLYDVRQFIANKRYKLSNSATPKGSTLLVCGDQRRIGSH